MNYKSLYDGAFKGRYAPIECRPEHKLAVEWIRSNSWAKSHLDVGTGRGSLLAIMQDINISTTTMDIGLYHDFKTPHIYVDLTSSEDLKKFDGLSYDVVTCLGVIEHIEDRYVVPALQAMVRAGRHVLLAAANHPDGSYHLNQHDHGWWVSTCNSVSHVTMSMDLSNGRLIYLELKGGVQ